ncbi:sulfite oxidase heme-binding subunit YedZ [Arcobacter sp.]|uniref:sulfite oxidase heme-binding subunit YedZ n=1 Tax=Arcobacter sp. TaxID=1872629 RepID=UPI003D0A68B1
MKKVIFILLFLPSLILAYEIFYLQNVTDPIKYIYTVTGAIALVLLFFTTTISLIRKKINLMSYRKMVGLFGFYYAFLHLLNFLILDMELDLDFAFSETLDKPFIYLGMISFLILLFMTITSFGKLFKLYFKYHKVIYIVLALITIHFIMAQKSLSEAQMAYVGIILIIAYFKFRQRVKLNHTF